MRDAMFDRRRYQLAGAKVLLVTYDRVRAVREFEVFDQSTGDAEVIDEARGLQLLSEHADGRV